MNRAARRAQDERAKAKAWRVQKMWNPSAVFDKGDIGRLAAMHSTCPCWCCTADRKTDLPKRDQMLLRNEVIDMPT